MILRGILACSLITLTISPARSTPFDDLSSPLPEVRAKAAEQIREQHLSPPSPREPWTHLLADIDLKKQNAVEVLLSRLRPNTATPSSFPPDGRIGFPLDSYWALACAMQDGRLVNFEIRLREFRVMPPPHYSGFWLTYRADGTLAAIYDYQNGLNLGDTLHMR